MTVSATGVHEGVYYGVCEGAHCPCSVSCTNNYLRVNIASVAIMMLLGIAYSVKAILTWLPVISVFPIKDIFYHAIPCPCCVVTSTVFIVLWFHVYNRKV